VAAGSDDKDVRGEAMEELDDDVMGVEFGCWRTRSRMDGWMQQLRDPGFPSVDPQAGQYLTKRIGAETSDSIIEYK
jgi:hypothetical protein